MATINKFEELEIWQLAWEYARRIWLLTCEPPFSIDYKLRDQINDAAGSSMDNIAEGFERDGNKEFIQFLIVAKASAGETRSQWHRLFDKDYITNEEYNKGLSELHGITYLISQLITYLQKSELKGTKFHKRNSKPDS